MKGIRVQEGGAVSGVDLILADGKPVHGRVLDAQGAGIEGAEVQMLDGSTSIDRAKSGADGRFELSWCTEYFSGFSASKPGYEETMIKLESDPFPAGEILIVLERSALLAGHVRADGDGHRGGGLGRPPRRGEEGRPGGRRR
ncbi:MAG: carboxypeptidase regulatory-like domain-containing protein [Planctomycetes bacterium]|nr:carboxypeptidase regulatory-like domain-containing protein [Planctomycetota bacterium]